ncbi:MAG: tetratricopeptide repeat protein [bacterium]
MKNLLPDLKLLGWDKNSDTNSSGQINASILFVDISGFTGMTRKLMEIGKSGAEVLSEFMNTIFSPLIKSVYSYDGFIINFAGDAFTAVFKDDDGKRAIATAVEIRNFFIENPVLTHKNLSFKISAKSGISSGMLNWVAAKGGSLRHFLFLGNSVNEAAEAEHCCVGNDICVNGNTYEKIKESLTGSFREKAFFVEKMKTEVSKKEREASLSADDLKEFIPHSVINQRIAGEFREVVSLFISYDILDNNKEIEEMLSFFAKLVEKYGGYISGFDFGDKGPTLLVLFGAPVSFEDNLERALNCLGEIRKNITTEMRSGITEGVVYAGFTGSSKRAAYTALGDNVNLAARLMMQAPSGHDWITGKAALKAKNWFNLKSAGFFKFKGIEKEIEVFKIKEKLKQKESASFSTAFTGRIEELSELLGVAENAVKFKKLHSYSVFGEAGIGKSRLVYEIKKKKEGEFRILSLSADTILRQSMNILTSFFQKFFDQNENVSAEENKARFEEKWDELSAEITAENKEFEAAKPYIGALCGVFWKGSVYELLDAKSRYENTTFAVADFFLSLAQKKPLMIVLDDIHAMDKDSFEILKNMTKKLSDFPVVMYQLSRLNDDGTKPESINVEEGSFKEMVIDRLLKSDVPHFVKNILNGEAAKELSEFIFARSEGNPFFMEQLVLFMSERNYLLENKGVFSIKVGNIEVPGEVNSLLVSRLDRLSHKLKDLVFKASVLGNDIDLTVLSEIVEDEEMSDTLKEGIDELIWNEISKLIYSFRHALLRDAAYSMQLNARLREIHLKVARAIETNYSDEERVFSSLAFHFEKAGNFEKEVYYLKKAADYSKSQYHNADAERMYEKLMTMLTEDEGLIETGHLLGSAYKISGKWDLAEKTFRESLKKASDLNKEILVASSMKELGHMLLEKGRYEEASPLLDDAVALYQKLEDVQGEGEVEGFRGLIHYYKGELDDAIGHFTKKLELAEKIDDKAAKALSYRYLGGVSYYRSDYATALSYYSKQLEISKETEDMLNIAVAENNLGLCYSHTNDFKNAAIFYGNALETYKKIGIRQYVCYTSNNLGELKFWLGEYDEARQLFENLLNIASELGMKRHVSIAYNSLGNISRKKRDFIASENFYDKAIAIGEELNVQTILCEYYYEKASLLYEMNRFDEAEELAEKALKMSAEVNRLDFHFRSELLKWNIVSQKEKDKAVEMIKQMLSCNTKDENVAELNYHLYTLTSEKPYFEKATELFKNLHKEAPKAIYHERIESLKLMKTDDYI